MAGVLASRPGCPCRTRMDDLGATGKETALHDSIFTTIPGSPAYVGKASTYRAKAPGFNVAIENHNAVSGSFR